MPESLTVLPTATHAMPPWMKRVVDRSDRLMSKYRDEDYDRFTRFMESIGISPEDTLPIANGRLRVTAEDAIAMLFEGVEAWLKPVRRINSVGNYLRRNNRAAFADYEKRMPQLMVELAPHCTSTPRCPYRHPNAPQPPPSDRTAPVDALFGLLDPWLEELPGCHIAPIETSEEPAVLPFFVIRDALYLFLCSRL